MSTGVAQDRTGQDRTGQGGVWGECTIRAMSWWVG